MFLFGAAPNTSENSSVFHLILDIYVTDEKISINKKANSMCVVRRAPDR